MLHYPFIVNLGKYDRIYNTIGDPYFGECVSNIIKNINIKLSNMITDINKSND